jgi:glycosyltransferase involved in cell wall biosynthesis
MKIVLLASGSVRSSLTARLVNIGSELVKRGHEVYMIAPSADKYNDFKEEKINELEGIKIINPYQFVTRNRVLNLIPYIPSAFFKILFLRADIIQIYKPTPLTIVGLLARSQKKTKIVLDMDDLGSAVMVLEEGQNWATRLVAWCEEKAARSADGIIVASSFLQRFYQKEFPKKPIIWVPNGIQKLPQLSHTTDRETPRIVFLGSINNRDVLKPLFESLPEIKKIYSKDLPLVHIVGDGSELSYFEAFVRQNNLTDMVQFHGWIDSQKIGDIIAPGDLGYYCVPDQDTYKAASSQKIFQYMSYEIVPVVNAIGDLPFYVENGKSGYIVSVEGLAAQLVELLKDQKGRMERGREGKRHVQESFLWPHLTDAVEDLYKRVTSEVK